MSASRLTAQYFPQDTKQTLAALTHPFSLFSLSFCSSLALLLRERATLVYSLLCLSLAALSFLPVHLSLTKHTISPSHIRQQHQLILSLSCHGRISHSPSRSRNWNSLSHFCPLAHYSFCLLLSLCSHSCSYISHFICTLLLLSTELGDRACRRDMHPTS